jgi:hypothetical protein
MDNVQKTLLQIKSVSLSSYNEHPRSKGRCVAGIVIVVYTFDTVIIIEMWVKIFN